MPQSKPERELTIRPFTWPRAGACLWLLCFQFFVAEQIARLGWVGHYSMTRDYISDLGAMRSSLHWVMNSSFVLQGLLIFFGTVIVRRYFPKGWEYQAALVLFALAGLGVLLVGLFPEDIGFRWHILGAAGNFLGGNLAMIVLGLVMIRGWRSWVTFAAGAIGLLATVALVFRGSPWWAAMGWDAGAVERLAAYPLPLWLTWTGFLMLNGWFPELAPAWGDPTEQG